MKTIIRRDSSNALARLHERYRAPLLSFFARRVHSRVEAEDLTQEVFLRLIRRGDADTRTHADGFVFTIAANLLRDRSRRLDARRAHAHVALDGSRDEAEQPAGVLPQQLIEELAPERVVLGRESLAQVLAVLNELDQRTRDVLIPHRMEK